MMRKPSIMVLFAVLPLWNIFYVLKRFLKKVGISLTKIFHHVIVMCAKVECVLCGKRMCSNLMMSSTTRSVSCEEAFHYGIVFCVCMCVSRMCSAW